MLKPDLKTEARKIFAEALQAVDAGAAVRREVKLSGATNLQICGENYDLSADFSKVYAVSIGKAGYKMALALDEILGGKLTGGVVSGILTENSSKQSKNLSLKWHVFAGGHPLPNEASLAAAQSAFELLEQANNEQKLVIFLISGGGSAMFEMPISEAITLADLREANRILVSCGAEINEINTIRRAFSRVKGGGLAKFAARAVQVSLIISDTENDDESSVASGLTFECGEIDPGRINSIIERYDLAKKLSPSIIGALIGGRLESSPKPENLRRHHVLLDNQNAVRVAAECAEKQGFIVEIAPNISQQNVEIGCGEIVSQMKYLLAKLNENQIVCLISGGEFSCPVRGNGIGGRNSETVLRIASMLDENKENFAEAAFLSAGTDGIDGNSLAAGAVCDGQTLSRAQDLNLDAQIYLETSDSFAFFERLEDIIITGATATNVRDLRLMLARK